MATTITRTAWTDDDGSGTTGTVINNAVKTSLYDQIDALFAGAFSLVGPLTVTGFGTHAFSAGGTGANSLRVRNTTAGTANYSEIALGNDTSAVRGYLEMFSTTYTPVANVVADGLLLQSDGAGGLAITAGHASGTLKFFSGGTTEQMRLDTAGNVLVGGTAARATTVGTKAIQLFDGTEPAGTLANGVSIYSKAGKLWAKDAAGTATQLTP